MFSLYKLVVMSIRGGKRPGVPYPVTDKWVREAQTSVARARARGISQAALSKRVPISEAEFSRVVNGENKGSSLLPRISEVLEIEMPPLRVDALQGRWLDLLERARGVGTEQEVKEITDRLERAIGSLEVASEERKRIEEKRRRALDLSPEPETPQAPPKKTQTARPRTKIN